MASPDISKYVDVKVYDKSPDQIKRDAISYARTVLPEFSPVTGGVEDALLQASSWFTAELMGSINRMTSGTLEVVLQLLGITRQSGIQPSGTLIITMTDNLQHVVPAGTRFAYRDNTDPANPILYTFDTDEDLTVAPGEGEGEVDISGVFYTEYPALSGGQAVQLLTPISFIQGAVLGGDLEVGSSGESDTDFFNRAIATLNSYSQGIVLPEQFNHYVLANYTDIYRVKTYSRVAAGADFVSGWTPVNGRVTIYVSRVGGASPSPTAMNEIAEDVAERAVAGLIINVEPAHIEPLSVVVSITTKSGYVGADVREDVTTALRGLVHPDWWPWSTTVYLNEIISLIDNVDGVDRVVLVTLNGQAADYTFARFGTLPNGSFSVSIV